MDTLSLIDWPLLIFGALWISGLAVVLTTLGFANYRASLADEGGLRTALERPTHKIGINAGLALFCAGMAGTAEPLWESIMWTVLGLSFVYYTSQAWLELRASAGTE